MSNRFRTRGAFGSALFLFVFTFATCTVPLGSNCLHHNPSVCVCVWGRERAICVASGPPEPSSSSQIIFHNNLPAARLCHSSRAGNTTPLDPSLQPPCAANYGPRPHLVIPGSAADTNMRCGLVLRPPCKTTCCKVPLFSCIATRNLH